MHSARTCWSRTCPAPAAISATSMSRGKAGRLYAAGRVRQPVDQQDAVPEARLRRDRLRPGGAGRAGAADPGGARRQPGPQLRRFRRARPPRRRRGRHPRQWQPGAPVGRADPKRGRDPLDPCALQGRRAGGERPARRHAAGRADQHRRGDRPREGRSDARALRLLRPAHRRAARGPDPGRGRHARRHGGGLARHRRPGRHRSGDPGAGQRGAVGVLPSRMSRSASQRSASSRWLRRPRRWAG